MDQHRSQGRLTRILRVGLAAAILTSCGAMANIQVARALSDGAFTYTVSGGEATITGCQGTCPSEVVIPASIGSYPVRSVGGFSNGKIKTVTIANSVATINEYAFSGNEISSLSLGDSVRTIGNSAFVLNQLNSIAIPATVQWIGIGAFGYNEIAFMYFRGDAPTLQSLPGVSHEFLPMNRATLEYIARSPAASGWTTEFAGFPVVAVDPGTRTRTQLISMQSFTDRPLGQAIRFNVAVSSSSTRPVSITATGSCARSDEEWLGDMRDVSLGPLSVTVLDIGICTIRAFESGNYEWLPAETVVRSFRLQRSMLSNVKVQFLDAEGNPGRISVSWSSIDGKFVSTKNVSTNSQGIAVFPKLPTGGVGFTYSGSVGDWKTQLPMGTGMLVRPSTTPLQMVIGRVGYPPSRIPTKYRIQVIMADGTVVPGASVQIGSDSGGIGSPGPPCMGGNRGDAWDFTACVVKAVTNSAGFSTLNVIGPFSGSNYYGVKVSITDGDVSTIAYGTLDHELTVVELEQMPAAYIETDPLTLNYGTAQTVTAVARDSDGSPIVGRSLTLSASTSGASASCSGRKTTATTNSAGRATFKVCPVKTATWSVDGRSIVGSAGVRLTVQLTPTAPRTLIATPKTRSVSLTWAAPAKANAGSVTDYIVQYRLQGATTWITFRDGTNTARKATVTGLTSGQVYEFRVAAKNKSGTGTWSDVVLVTSN